MKILFPDYDKSFNNFASSILKKFGLDGECSSLIRVDRLLKENDYDNVIVLSFNGLSNRVMERYLDNDSILLSNKVANIVSTFPASDFTSTMTFLSGENPSQHGFINGWFESDDLGKNIGTDMIGKSNECDRKFESIFDKINNSGLGKAYGIFPFGKGKYVDREDAYKTIVNLSNSSSKKLIYAYFDNLDKVMMSLGIESLKTQEEIGKIEVEIKQLCDKLSNSIVFIISGYGNVECSKISLGKYKSLISLVEKVIEIEPRCVGLKVLEERQEEFRKGFEERLGDKFLLLSWEEILSKGLFGAETVNLNLKKDIGDFVAIATDEYYLSCGNDGKEVLKTKFVACHGGLTEKEMFLPIIAIRKKPFNDGIRLVNKKDYDEIRKMSIAIQKYRVEMRKDLFSNVSPVIHSDFINFFGRNASETCFVYTIEDKIVGFIKVRLKSLGGKRLYTDFAYIEIENVFVKDEYRRKGIGTELVNYVMGYARKRHVKKVEFRAWNFEEETFKFIEKFKSNTLFTVFEIDL